MPVQRFRTFDDARRALWADEDDPQLTTRIRRLWCFSTRFVPHCVPRGVRKFRNVEEANLERDAWITQRVRILRAERQG
jgi:hypothetical protein